MESLVKQVYIALKEYSRNINFVSIINANKEDCKILLTNEEIELIRKNTWKQLKKK